VNDLYESLTDGQIAILVLFLQGYVSPENIPFWEEVGSRFENMEEEDKISFYFYAMSRFDKYDVDEYSSMVVGELNSWDIDLSDALAERDNDG